MARMIRRDHPGTRPKREHLYSLLLNRTHIGFIEADTPMLARMSARIYARFHSSREPFCNYALIGSDDKKYDIILRKAEKEKMKQMTKDRLDRNLSAFSFIELKPTEGGGKSKRLYKMYHRVWTAYRGPDLG